MDESSDAGDFEAIPFYIGHHELHRQELVTDEIFHHAEDLGVRQ